MPVAAWAVLSALLSACSAWGITWDFSADGDAQGWVATYPSRKDGLATVLVARGVLRIPFPPYVEQEIPQVALLSPLLQHDSALFDRFVLRMRVIHPQPVRGQLTLSWTNEFSDLPWDIRMQRYRLELTRLQEFSNEWQEVGVSDLRLRPLNEGQPRPQVGWAGQLQDVTVRFDVPSLASRVTSADSIPQALEIDWIRLTGPEEQRLGELPPPVPEPKPSAGHLFAPAAFTAVEEAGGLRMGGLPEVSSALGDLDGDGDLDLVEGISVMREDLILEKRLWFLFDTVRHRFHRVLAEDSPGWAFECGADVDADGRMEVLVSTADGPALVRYGSRAETPALRAFPAMLYPLGFGDAEGDGDLDLFMVRWDVQPGRVILFRNDGHGNLADDLEIPAPRATEGSPLRMADTWRGGLRRRGVVWRAAQASEGVIVSHIEPTGEVMDERLRGDFGPSPFLRYVGDYDRDGDLDVVSADTQDARWSGVYHGLSYWVNDGSDNLTRQSWLPDFTSHPDDFGPNLGMFDLNGDGVADPVLWELDVRGNALLVGLGRANGIPEFEGRYPVVEGAMGRVFGGDVDGDGDTDLVVLHMSPGIHVMFNRTLSETAVVQASSTAPGAFALGAAYPNPFNPQTCIPFEVPQGGATVRLEVFDLLGQPVRTLVAGSLPAGRHVAPWDGRDAQGRDVAAGVYLYRLQPRTWQRTGKVVKVD